MNSRMIPGILLLLSIATPAWSAALQNNGNGTIADLASGLTWQQTDDGEKKSWATAQTYCAELALGGKKDWRLPFIKELVSIADYRISNPAIDETLFLSVQANPLYWSASDWLNDQNAWVVDFSYGSANATGKTTLRYVRCVR